MDYNLYMGISPNQGYLFGGLRNKDTRILGSILGSIWGNYDITLTKNIPDSLRTPSEYW